MSRKAGVYIALIVFVLIGIALIDSGAKRPVDWSKSYDIRHKKPYGLYVFHEEVADMLGEDYAVTNYGRTYYELIDSTFLIDASKKSIIDIISYQGYYNLEKYKILNFLQDGGEVFIARDNFDDSLLDTLGIQVTALEYPDVYLSEETVSFTLGSQKEGVKFPRIDDFYIFSKLNPSNTLILGYLLVDGRYFPNFIRVSYGKGYIYIHLLAEVFTNYHMLHKNTYEYAHAAVGVIQNKDIFFKDYNYNWQEPTTPLRVVLSKPGFKEAWYLLLFGLVVLLLFKSRREQRAVKVVLPEPNLSKEFAKTIATVYYENGDPGNIIHKKIEYFLFALRTAYYVDTVDLLNNKFIHQLSSKSTVSKGETHDLMRLISRFKSQIEFSVEDVKIINNKIEDFKRKANL